MPLIYVHSNEAWAAAFNYLSKKRSEVLKLCDEMHPNNIPLNPTLAFKWGAAYATEELLCQALKKEE